MHIRGLELLIFGNFCVLCLLVAIVSRSVLWPYYQRIALITARKVSKYGDFLVQIQKNKDQKKIRTWTFFTQYLVLLFCNKYLSYNVNFNASSKCLTMNSTKLSGPTSIASDGGSSLTASLFVTFRQYHFRFSWKSNLPYF